MKSNNIYNNFYSKLFVFFHERYNKYIDQDHFHVTTVPHAIRREANQLDLPTQGSRSFTSVRESLEQVESHKR